ncbi:MAG: aspartate/glutamate racemase family protein [Firmicutes bacterium]|nr:aspartate/glutamate racemase family protein [Bacillota bacterium]
MKDILGVIGGMGPMASKLFYEMITAMTAADKDQDHINMVILSHATMPDRTGAIFAGDETPGELLLEDCRTLESMGCRAICATCNTAHYFIHRFEDKLSIPVISLIRETAKEAARLHPGGKVAIMATDGTIRTRLYQDALEKEGVVPYVLSPENQKLAMHIIYDCVKAGKRSDEDAFRRIDAELKDSGCEGALLACTEFSVMKTELGLGAYYIDPMEVMARRAIEFMGKKVGRSFYGDQEG